MFSEYDEGRGVVKTCWSKMRKRVHKINPEFAKLVDEVEPDDKSMPLFLAYYPYGQSSSDTVSPIMPTQHGETYRLLENEAPKEIFKHLGYGSKASPVGMLMNKRFELFVDLPHKNITIPKKLYKPGDIFPLGSILRKYNSNFHPPNGILKVVAGARSAFMLPYIGSAQQYQYMTRDFKIKKYDSTQYYNHFDIFKNLAESRQIGGNWRGCMMYFSKIWITKILNDHKWLKIKLYLYQFDWHQFEFERNNDYFDLAFSLLEEKFNLKPSPYYAGTIKYLYKIALGKSFGFTPALDENYLPTQELQNAFVESYGIRYIPTIMHARYFDETEPVYYSLQNPSTDVIAYHSRKSTSTIYEMRELARIIEIYKNELKKEDSICQDTYLHQLCKKLEFTYFHNRDDNHAVAKSSSAIYNDDRRFWIANNQNNLEFSQDAKFFRGCIKLEIKST